jgi:hypothetical protein
MFGLRVSPVRSLAILILVLTIAANIEALALAGAAFNIQGGYAANTINSYTINSVIYETNADNDPGTIDWVRLDLTLADNTSTASEVSIKLVSHSNNWSTCSNADDGLGTSWDCAITGVNTADVDELAVVAIR